MKYQPPIVIYGEEYYTPAEAAAALDLKIGTIYNLVLAGRLRPVRRQGSRRGPIVISAKDVQEYKKFKGRLAHAHTQL